MPARSAYGPNPHAGASRNNARARGWGSGWPNAQTKKMRTVVAAGVRVSVRREVAELVETLLVATERMGYDVKAGQTWGFANRPIRGTRIPSNHSWGLAVDINSLANPMQSRFRSDIPPDVVDMWEACGWYWGGRYRNRPDAMHFEYLGRPSSVAADLRKARAYLKDAKPKKAPRKPPPEDRPTIDLRDVIAAFRADPERPQGRGLHPGDIRPIEIALRAEGLLPAKWAHDGYAGTMTRKAYAKWQKELGYTGKDADGIPGRTSLTKLGSKHGFRVR